jgi:DNA polymerase I-like protein with 3'-5' exonuclease and polymerase domains
MDYLSEIYLNYKPVSIESLIGKKGKNQGTLRDVSLEQQTNYAAEMKKILTPEQYQKWDADKKAKMEKRREMMKDRKGEFGKRKMMKKPADAPVVE